MSRTVLLSEVKEVAGRYPEMIAETRGRLATDELPANGEAALEALADRLAGDAFFRRDLHDALSAIFASAPQMNHLEVLAVLVAAAVGPERAIALADDAAADLPLRALFKFLLASRRRWRDAMEDLPGSWDGRVEAPLATGAAPQLETMPQTVAALDGTRPKESVVAEKAVPARVLVTASAPGDSGMLGRALALAADEEPTSVEPPVSERREERVRPLHAGAEPVAARTLRPERVRLWTSPAPRVDVAEHVDEEAEERPRRWGMGTAVMCGVLIGFAVGAFVHFDHKPAPAGPPVAASQTAQQADDGVTAKVKSVDELRAEIAALDSLADAPVLSRAAGRLEPGAVLPGARERRTERKAPRQAYAPVPPAHGQSVTVVRSPGKANAKYTPGPVSGAGSSAAARTAALPLTAAVRPVNLSTGPAAANSVFRTASAVHLPHVITGSAGIMAANLVSSPAPAYPAAASAAGVQGEVIVEAVVGRGGEVLGTRVVSGPLLLRAAALDAVQRWQYRPYEVDGKPVEVATTARLEFRLDQ